MSQDQSGLPSSAPDNQPPDRTTGVLNILLAVLLFVAAVVVLLVAQQRGRQAALFSPTPTVVVRVVTFAPTKPAITVVATAVATKAPASVTTPSVAAATSPAAGQATSAPAGTVAGASATKPAVTGASPTAAKSVTGGTTTVPATTVPATTAAATKAPAATVAAGSTSASPTAAATTAQSSLTWYFAEGASVSPFKTWYSIFNPGQQQAKVTVTLYPEDGKSVERSVTVAAGSDLRFLANDLIPSGAFGAGISSDQPVYVERFTLGDRDGTTSSGMTPTKTWYFPEGQTGDDFTTWLLVLNPGTSPAAITVTYLPVTAKPIVKTYTAPPGARLTISADKDVPAGIEGIIIQSNQPVVAEHSIYFDSQKAAYGGPGVTALAKKWYVGSGNTQVGFTARIAVVNPGTQPAIINVTLYGSKQKPVTALFSIDPQSKDDIVLNDQADEQLVAAVVESDQPVAAEIATYYLSGGETAPIAAYSAPAISTPANNWFVPELMTDSQFDGYLSIFNAGSSAASVTVTYAVQGGDPVVKTYDVAALAHPMLRVGDEVKGKNVTAATVRSTQPVVVERVTMFRTTVGATSSAGIVAP